MIIFAYFAYLDAEECASQPCQNGGQCFDGLGTNAYACLCLAGWTGTNCENGKLVLSQIFVKARPFFLSIFHGGGTAFWVHLPVKPKLPPAVTKFDVFLMLNA